MMRKEEIKLPLFEDVFAWSEEEKELEIGKGDADEKNGVTLSREQKKKRNQRSRKNKKFKKYKVKKIT